MKMAKATYNTGGCTTCVGLRLAVWLAVASFRKLSSGCRIEAAEPLLAWQVSTIGMNTRKKSGKL
jgi:hypothetical protein